MNRPATTASKPFRRGSQSVLAASYPRLLLDLVAEHGIDPTLALAGTQLTRERLETPDARISSRQAARMVHNALALTGRDALGIEYGLQLRPTAHGLLGYAVMSCANLQQALELALRFVQLRQQDVTPQFSLQGDWAVIEISDNHALGPLRRFFYECLMVGLLHSAALLLARDGLDAELHFDWPEPPYFATYRAQLPRTLFGQRANLIRFPAALLQRPLLMSDPVAARQAREQCERELAQADDAGDAILPRVRAVIGGGGYPTLEATAARLHLSTRTLKRRLQDAGSSYRQLLDEVRYRDALRLLANPDLEMQQIAQALGYTDPACFTRACRRWTGKPPSALRSCDRN